MTIIWYREDKDSIPYAVCQECSELFQWGNDWDMVRLEGHEC